LYAQALHGREEKLGFNHADTIATVHHVAVSYRMQGKLDEAKVLYLRALDARERDDRLGRNHLDTLRTIEGLGMIAEAQNKYLEAEKCYHRALDGFRKQMTEDCPDVIRAVENIARILDKLGRHEDALPHHRRLSSISNSKSNRKDESEIDRRLGDFRRLSSFSDMEDAKESGLKRWASSDSRGSRNLSVLSSFESTRGNVDKDLKHLSVSSSSDSCLSNLPGRRRSSNYSFPDVFDTKPDDEG
jgi:tetratricopeptide (TPR) repeat protein